MWRSFSRESSKSEAKEGDLSKCETRRNEGSCISLQRQLWIWIHPSALDEGLDAIKVACDKQVLPLFFSVGLCMLPSHFEISTISVIMHAAFSF
jgi:ribonuclease P/MRP protein subunit POP1